MRRCARSSRKIPGDDHCREQAQQNTNANVKAKPLMRLTPKLLPNTNKIAANQGRGT
jgi:hypothetical protein